MTDKIIIRSYSKAIFFFPTLILSIFGWIFQAIVRTPTPIVELIWVIMFFLNIFVVCFDFSSSKFIILLLSIALGAAILYFTVFPTIFKAEFFSGGVDIQLGFTSHFYIIMTAILSFILLIAMGQPFLDYYTIERNELYHRKGLFTMTERWTLTNLRFVKEIPDIFEFMVFRAGTIKFYPTKTDVIILPTVLGINKKETELNYLLSSIKVDTE
jgi:hypothetical protein